MNERKFERFGFRAEALITHRDVTVRGEVSDLSLKGLFVAVDYPLAVDDMVSVALNFDGAGSNFAFSIPAKVVRKTEKGVGLSFARIDMDSVVYRKLNRVADEVNPEEDAGECNAVAG